MRMTANIPDKDIGVFAELAETTNASREDLILRAVSDLLRPGAWPRVAPHSTNRVLIRSSIRLQTSR